MIKDIFFIHFSSCNLLGKMNPLDLHDHHVFALQKHVEGIRAESNMN